MPRRPTNARGRNGGSSRGSDRSRGGRTQEREAGGRRYGGGGSGRRSGGGGGNNTGAIVGGVIVVLVLIVGAVVMMGGDEENGDKAPTIDSLAKSGNSGGATKKETPVSYNNDASSKKTPDGSTYVTGAEWRKLAQDVDRTKWSQIQNHMVKAEEMKRDAIKLQTAGKQAEFEKLMGQAVREWRKGDLLFEQWQEEIEFIKEGLWDGAFSKEDKKLQRWTRSFRGYLQYESK